MTDTLDTELRLSLHGLLRQTDELATLTDLAKLSYAAHLPSGILAGQADKIWHDERTLAAGASDMLSLDALEMPALGGTLSIALAKVKLLRLVNTATAAGNDLHVGGAGSGAHAWSGPWNNNADAKSVVPADSPLLVVGKLAGWTVTPGTSNVLKVHNPGASAITYRIAIVGTSA